MRTKWASYMVRLPSITPRDDGKQGFSNMAQYIVKLLTEKSKDDELVVLLENV